MIELRTLGTLGLRAADGREVESLLAHPKRAGLLAYLAAARPRGFHRRDALLALFWPELDQERARTALRKAVFQIRRALGDEVLVGRGDEELRLADHLVWCDARALDESLDSGDLEGAIALYQGPFLDAFFVADAAGFERWMDDERTRLHGRAHEAAWRLALRDEQLGNVFGATYWARRAAELAPHDEGAVRRLIELLDRQGDRAGAVHAYEAFARRLTAEYEIEPSAETQALVRQIRTRAVEPAVATIDAPGVPSYSVDSAEVMSLAGASPPAAHSVDMETRRRARRRMPLLIVAAASVIGAAIVVGVAWRRPSVRTEGRSDVVAVFPFTVRGGPSVAYLGEGMASLLAMALDGTGELRSVDPQALLGAMHRDGRSDGATTAATLARGFGAGVWVVGDVVESDRRLRINATLYDARHPERPRVLASAEGSADSLFVMVDRLAAELFAGQGNTPPASIARVAALTTHSLPALRAYLEGERAFRRGKFREALNGFQESVSLDSSFALAYYRLASAYAWSSNDSAGAAADRAVKLSGRLSPPTRQLVEAFRYFIAGEPDSAERHYREILVRRPEDVEALFQLGEVLFHDNPPRGRSALEAMPFFERAVSFNDGDAPLIHLLELVALQHEYVRFDSLLAGVQPGSHFFDAGQMVHAFTTGDERARVRVEAVLRKARDSDLAAVAAHSLFLIDDARSAARVVRLLDEPSRPDELRLVGRLLQAHIAMGAGRWRDAGRWLDSASSLDPVRAAEHAALLHAIPTIPIPTWRLEQVRAQLERAAPLARVRPAGVLHTGDEAHHAAIISYGLALMHTRLGHLDEASRLAATLDRAAGGDTMSLPASLRSGARAQSMLLAGHAEDALRELSHVVRPRRAVDILGYSPVVGLRHERFLRAEATSRVDRPADADAWFSAFEEHSPFARLYLAPASLRRAEIAEGRGRRDEAARHYARVVSLWRDADPELQPIVRRARTKAASHQ